MQFRPSQPVNRPVLISLCLMLVATAAAAAFAATAHASGYYPMLLCAGNNGSGGYATATNTVSSTHPGGIFSLENHCGPAPDPAGNSAFLRIAENQSAGNAGYTAYGSISWTTAPWVAIVAAGGYTREPNAFNAGWRGRFWAEGWDGSTNNILMQGSGVANGSLGGIGWATTSTFAPHLWPFGGYGDYRRFVFEMTCYRQAGCDRTNFNAVDANTLHLTLDDRHDPSPSFLASDTVNGKWVRGETAISWYESDLGSGLRFSRLKLDGAALGGGTIDYQANGACDAAWSAASGEFARRFNPCPGGPYQRSYGLKTQDIADGQHGFAICLQDYGQYRSGGETCDARTIHTDNTAPGKPAALQIRSANPHRYLDRFGATFSLPPNSGAPIVAVHYQVLNAANEVVVPTKTVSAVNPSELAGIQGPAKAGAYHLKLWLTDQVGFDSPPAEVAIPHDTTPPAAPQELRIAGETSRWAERVELRWRNVTDDGAPIDTAHYRFLDAAGEPVGSTQTISAQNPEAIESLKTPAQRGRYKVQVWLADAEGNVGAAASVPLPLDTTPPAAPQGLQVAAPDTPRSAEGFDLRWRNVADDGAPIDAAHYQVLDGSGALAVDTQTVKRAGVSSIADVQAPSPSGGYTLRLWLEDAEGNAGVPASVSLSYECDRSPVPGGAHLDASLSAAALAQGQGSTLTGALRRASRAPVAGAPLCVTEQVEGERRRRFLGLAYTDAAGNYRFAIAPGPNRTLRAVYRPGNRRLLAAAQLRTQVKPTLRAARRIVHTGEAAHLQGEIPGPRNDDVVIVLQVHQGRGWLAFRRYRTRGGGRFKANYLFRRTTRPTTYEFRAQVRESGGYPYLEGDSDPLSLRVLPRAKRRRCPRGRHPVKRHGKTRCAHRASARARCAHARRALHHRPTARALRRRAHRLCRRARHRRHAHRRAG